MHDFYPLSGNIIVEIQNNASREHPAILTIVGCSNLTPFSTSLPIFDKFNIWIRWWRGSRFTTEMGPWRAATGSWGGQPLLGFGVGNRVIHYEVVSLTREPTQESSMGPIVYKFCLRETTIYVLLKYHSRGASRLSVQKKNSHKNTHDWLGR